MTKNGFGITELQWFEVKLKIEALEHRSRGLSYRFYLEKTDDEREQNSLTVRCDVYYSPDETRIDRTTDKESTEYFLTWRSSAIRMIKRALSDTPELAAQMLLSQRLKFSVFEGHGMGSAKVFEVVGDKGDL